MKTITRDEWETLTRHGYTHVLENGRKAILAFDEKTGGTVLEQVAITEPRATTTAADRIGMLLDEGWMTLEEIATQARCTSTYAGKVVTAGIERGEISVTGSKEDLAIRYRRRQDPPWPQKTVTPPE